ncbi:hypothetical protein ACG04R_16415 [Roseateles sp. BYS78W]|uniref:DUF1376 domain-containing protein n=1 Tax=Pelomonas candidula TaxID=3299025 RepID=A0ABW7HFJ3_9BURK
MKRTKGLERVLGAYTAALVTHAAFPALRAHQVGCLLGWARLALETGQAAVPRDDLAAHVTYFAGLDVAGFEQLLAELRAMRLVAVKDDGAVEMVQLAAAMNNKGAETERRKAGWEKRRQATSVVAPAPARPVAVPAQPVAPQPGVQGSLLEHEPVSVPAPAPKKVAAAPKAPSGASTLRIGAGDGDDSAVMVRMPVKGGEVQFTAAYLKTLEPLFPGIVTNWLSRAQRDREVTMAVVAAGNRRNGFGQGGGYSDSARTPAEAGDGLEDLMELIQPESRAPVRLSAA